VEGERGRRRASRDGGDYDVDAVVANGPRIQIRTRYATGPSAVTAGLGEGIRL